MASTGEVRLGRRPALDGLRGVAALVVLLVHALLANTWLADHCAAPLVAAGSGAVMVFFVLSGYVLTRPVLAGRLTSWRAYYAGRLLRLYVPVWGALAFAVLLASVVPRESGTGNWWLDYSTGQATAAEVVREASLFRHGAILNQLWSLQWEVAFSLLLPLYVAVFRRAARVPVLSLGLVVAAHVAGQALGVGSLRYLSVFGLGAFIAAVEPVQGWRTRGFGWLSRRPTLWLGRVSFSLYLVHLPVVLAVVRIPGGVLVTLPISVAASLVIASVFRATVEAPSQRLSASLLADLSERHGAQRRVDAPGRVGADHYNDLHVVASN